MMKKKWLGLVMAAALVAAAVSGCGSAKDGEAADTAGGKTDAVAEGSEAPAAETPAQTEAPAEQENVTMMLAAAASLENSMVDELIPMFEEANPNITVQGTYDSSGKLQTQIEEGADVDVFISAAMKQMNALDEEGLMDKESIAPLLENKIVMIIPASSGETPDKFEDLLDMESVAIGDPDSVPAGQYAKEAFESMGIWDKINAKASLGTNVTEVLNWVAEGSAQGGVVYATDAASTDKVKVVAEAPEGSVSQIIYPVGIVEASKNKEAAQRFVEFLQGADAMKVFEKYGFSQPAQSGAK